MSASDAGEQSAEPCEAGAIEEQIKGRGEEKMRRLKHMPELCTDDAGNGGNGDDADRVCGNAPAHEVLMENPAAADRSEPQHKAEGSNREGANVDEWIHDLLTS